MTILLLSLNVALLAVAATALVLAGRPVMRRGALERSVGRRVIVQTRDGQSIEGLLVGVHRTIGGKLEALTLSSARYRANADVAQIGGDVVVPGENFAWLNRAPGREATG